MIYLSDILSAESAAELSCLHHHDGVMVEPLDDVLMNNVLILPLRKKKKNLTRSQIANRQETITFLVKTISYWTINMKKN
jgi:hypothetical protein